MIPYGRQYVSAEDVEAVTEVLKSDFLTQGPAVPAFEAAIKDIVGVSHAVAANSATSALHIACMALGVGPGDLVWTVPNTFVASANCARYCGADVDFVDIDADSWNISVNRLREKLESARVKARLPAVVIPVHFGGLPTQQKEIWALAQEFGFKVIEDASHSIGAYQDNEAVGSCRWSDITIFSFHPVKIVTSGEGGMALTNSSELATAMELARSHGVTRDTRLFDSNSEADGYPAWYYEQHMLGFNYRMTDIHAALGRSQLGRLKSNIARRNEIAARYRAAFIGMPLQQPLHDDSSVSAWHLYVVRVANDDHSLHRQIFDRLRDKGIGVNVHYTPVHLQPYYRALGFAENDFPEAERHGRTAISLPIFATLTDEQVDTVIEAIKCVLSDLQ